MEEQIDDLNLMEEMKDLQDEEMEDQQEDQFQTQNDLQNAYGHPEQEEKYNQHRFISRTVFESDTPERISFLLESELGRPLFNVRFLLGLVNISRHYINPILKNLGMDEKDNRIAHYFRSKVNDICWSGLSRDGFIQNTNITKKMDSTRMRVKNPIENLQGRQNKRR